MGREWQAGEGANLESDPRLKKKKSQEFYEFKNFAIKKSVGREWQVEQEEPIWRVI